MTRIIDGILAVNKPPGLSSARVVARIKRRKGIQKVGHTGTLDPFATGVLLCGINKGTRISRFLLGGKKSYRAEVHLGVETDTLDGEGEITASAENAFMDGLSNSRITAAVDRFVGPLKQIPPVYSALKHQGVPLYKLARQGRPVEKPARDIEIYAIDVTGTALPRVTMDVDCSAGTYIRSLARDIGAVLGCGAHLSALCRTVSCGIPLAQTISLDALDEMDDDALNSRIIPMAQAISSMPGVTVDASMLSKIRFGQPLGTLIPSPAALAGDGCTDSFVRLLDPAGELAAVLEYDQTSGSYNYCCVFAD